MSGIFSGRAKTAEKESEIEKLRAEMGRPLSTNVHYDCAPPERNTYLCLYLLLRNMVITRPNQVCCADIT